MARTHPLRRIEPVLVVAIGGFAGANVRFLVEGLVSSTLLATLAVNVLGSAALGVVLYEELYRDAVSAQGRRLLGTGFLASFTTYSTFVLDAIQADPVVGIAYVLGSYATGFAAVLVGRAIARRATDRDRAATEVTG